MKNFAAQMVLPTLGASLVLLTCLQGYLAVAGRPSWGGRDRVETLFDREKAARANLDKSKSKSEEFASLEDLAAALSAEKKFSEAEECYRKAWKIAPSNDPVNFSRNGQRLASLYMDEGQPGQAKLTYVTVLNWDKATAPQAERTMARDYNNLGLSEYMLAQTKIDETARRHELQAALNDLLKAQEFLSGSTLPEPQLAYCRKNMQAVYSDLGETKLAAGLRKTVDVELIQWQRENSPPQRTVEF